MSDRAQDTWHVVICGGGPAGLVAGLYAVRGGMKTILVEKSMVGGMAATATHVENYPGVMDTLSGTEIAGRMSTQAKAFGLEIVELVSVDKIDRKESKHVSPFSIMLSNGQALTAKAMIIAGGSVPKFLNVDGEKELLGKGVSYCATCDGPFFRNQKIAVIGGGNTAIEEAIYLTQFASTVTVIHRRDKLRADWIVQERAFKNPKIEFAWNCVVKKIEGSNLVESILLRNVQTNQEQRLEAAGVFIYVGSIAQTNIVKDMITMDNDGYIVTDESMATSMPGMFAAGDCRKKPLRQIVTAAGDGAIAAMSAYKYIQENNGMDYGSK